MTIESQTTSITDEAQSVNPEAADIFVIFGITGDLAKVMTFRSLYRLERRGLLQCPIVGVAVND
jgi:glucose-6-phosphate 1-dehydrogenase